MTVSIVTGENAIIEKSVIKVAGKIRRRLGRNHLICHDDRQISLLVDPLPKNFKAPSSMLVFANSGSMAVYRDCKAQGRSHLPPEPF